ncbi:phosphopantetheine-binding protein [Pyxidicoccus trucidator]|uniref:phosphopantetheine-binding protein n=1 Tax=Pyxidicoccus trucidator TaxID=2709662 RepID=UPI0013D9C008|nr:phosphopantetheine-binding protein [Pyxidicoccus trucidator]
MTDMTSNHGAASEPLTEGEFIARAQRFLTGLGVDPTALDPDTNLVDTRVLDSLLLLAFLAFVEEQRGYEAEPKPEDLVAIRTLRTAYSLVHSRGPHDSLERTDREP